MRKRDQPEAECGDRQGQDLQHGLLTPRLGREPATGSRKWEEARPAQPDGMERRPAAERLAARRIQAPAIGKNI